MEYRIEEIEEKSLTFKDLSVCDLFKFKKHNFCVGNVLCLKTQHYQNGEKSSDLSFVAVGSGLSFTVDSSFKDALVEKYEQTEDLCIGRVR